MPKPPETKMGKESGGLEIAKPASSLPPVALRPVTPVNQATTNKYHSPFSFSVCSFQEFLKIRFYRIFIHKIGYER